MGIKAVGDAKNIAAAQSWECPCADRFSCISEDRVPFLRIYDSRQDFHKRRVNELGGRHLTMRAKCRQLLAEHYDAAHGFTRSFVIGPCGDICAAAAALAWGVSFGTFAAARADVTHGREPEVLQRRQKQSKEAAHLDSYIRDLRSAMEGSKGGTGGTGKFYTGKRSMKVRWEDYKRSRRAAKQPIIGSLSLFKKLWAQHAEIKEFKAKGHAKCDVCGKIQTEMAKFENNRDEESRQRMEELKLEQQVHDAQHRGMLASLLL